MISHWNLQQLRGRYERQASGLGVPTQCSETVYTTMNSWVSGSFSDKRVDGSKDTQTAPTWARLSFVILNCPE